MPRSKHRNPRHVPPRAERVRPLHDTRSALFDTSPLNNGAQVAIGMLPSGDLVVFCWDTECSTNENTRALYDGLDQIRKLGGVIFEQRAGVTA